MESIKIANRIVSNDEKPYVIAEIGSNHNGDMTLCRRIIDAAVVAGADAVKFQSWTSSSLISKSEYARNTSYSDTKKHFGSLEAMVDKYAFSAAQHQEINDYCHSKKITFLSSAFSPEEVDLLESLAVPVHKVASMDINNYLLLEAIAKTQKPVIVSTGMSSLSEIEKALNVLEKNNAGPIIMLHCVSIYPPEYKTINLRNIETLKMAFGKLVGFSDHTVGVSIPLAAIALGAVLIEKHFTIDKDLAGWDHAISADPKELTAIVKEGEHVFQSLGSHRRIVSQDELEKRHKFRRRIVFRHPMKKGQRITLADVDFKRPGNGIAPNELDYVLGRTLQKDVVADHELEWQDLLA